ncbi:imelysin family protein [Thalassolituus sp. LLYu03]|uniref:imelysin family protein n=1 Tax=Thalassolituus sp. LLYu03 TaxID=3421656 RepID=UPI003D288889
MKPLIALPALALLLSACGGERLNDEAVLSEGALSKAVQELAENTIIPAVTGFTTEATNLDDAASAFCADISSSNLQTLQAQWKTTSASWYRLLPFNFGPLDDDAVFPAYQYIDSYRLRGDNYLSSVRTVINQWLASSDTLDADFFNSLTFNKVGLLAIEVAAFETAGTQSSSAADIVSEYASTSRKCAVLTGLTGALKEKATYVQDGWQVAYVDSTSPYLTLFINDDLPDGASALSTLITAIQVYLDYLPTRNVLTTTATLSGNIWYQVDDSLTVIRELLAGTANSSVTLFSLMTSSGNSTAVATVTANLDQADENISDEDATSFNATAALLDGNFKREIPDSLDVSLGINFTDGD